MDWVRSLDALFVIATPALGRELGALRVIEVSEGTCRHVALLECVRPRERLEQPPPNDLESFLGSRRSPRRLHAPDHVAQPLKRLAPADAAHFRIVGLRVG